MKLVHDPKQSVIVSKADIDSYRQKVESVVKVGILAVQFDAESERRMRLALSSGDSVTWRMADNSERTFSNAEFEELINAAAVEAGKVISQAFLVARQLKEKDTVTLRDLESAAWPKAI